MGGRFFAALKNDGRGVRGWRGALEDYVGAFKNFCGLDGAVVISRIPADVRGTWWHEFQ